MCCSLKCVLCFLAGLAGLIWQVYYIQDEYFKYETVTRSDVNIEEEVQIPKLYIGFDEKYLLSTNKAFNRTLYNQDKNFYRYMYTPGANESTTICKTQNPNKQRLEKCPKIGQQFKNGKVYYHVGYGVSSLKSIQLPSLLYFIAISEIITNASFTFELYMIPHNQNLHGHNYEGYSAASVVVNGSSLWTTHHLSYTYHKNVLLPAPHDTNCFDYSTVGLESQAHCRYNCIEYNYNTLLNQTFPGTLVTAPHAERPKNVFTGSVKCNRGGIDRLCVQKIETECYQICRRNDCVKEWFIPTVRTTASIPGKELQIVIWPPTAPSTIITYQPTSSRTDLITYIFSCISFWFGVSPFGLLFMIEIYAIKQCITKICRRNNVAPVDVENPPQVTMNDFRQLKQQVEHLKDSLKKLDYLQV